MSILDALQCINNERPPVWLMRQAGRYLPEYRALRAKHSFLEMCHCPDLITQVTMMPIERFGFDAAILFSDILIILEALGRTVRFEEGRGPVIDHPLRCSSDIASLKNSDVQKTLGFVAEGIVQLKKRLSVPLLGFCGAPFTVASYLIEGGSSTDLALTKRWMYRDPVGFHLLLDLIAQASIDYLLMQISAGVDAIQIFDTWANALPYRQFGEFSLAYLDRIVQALRPTGKPVILFCRGSSLFAESLVALQPAAISFDWNCDLAHQRKRLGSDIALQGNLDPQLLFAPLPVIEREVNELLDAMEGDSGFILGLGHGILPETPLAAVETLVDCVKARIRV